MGAATALVLILLQSVSVHDRIQQVMAEAEARRVEMAREEERFRHEEAREFQQRAREMADAWIEFADQWNRGVVSVKAAEKFDRASERLRKHPLWPARKRK